MAVTVRGSGWGGASTNTSELLVGAIQEEIKVLEPQLRYAQLGRQRNAPKGFDRITFPQTNQLPVQINTSMVTVGGPGGAAGGGSVWGGQSSLIGGNPNSVAGGFPVSSVFGVAAITEGSNPTAVSWGATAYSTGPAQYGILVTVSDLLISNSAIEVVQSCTMQVKNALARMVDDVIQTVVNAGTNGVIYSGGKTSRTGLGAGDTITQADMIRAVKFLRSANAAGLEPFDGDYYVSIISPEVMTDLMSNTNSGSWSDMARYSSVEDIRTGRIGSFRGVRYLESAWQNYFNSTVSVFPTTLIGKDSFGWGYFQEPQAILVATPDSTNALNLFNSIGGKVTLGVTRFEDTINTFRIARIESAFTN